MDLQGLIDRGEELKSDNYDSPVVDLWENDVKAIVASYGDATSRVLSNAMHFGQVIMSDAHGQKMHVEKISKIQKLLQELQKRDSANMAAQSAIIDQKMAEAKATLGAKMGTVNIHGPVTFGNNSPANNIQVGELFLAIISEAEDKLPDGTEKDDILNKLKSVASNPTFAAMAGASLPEIVKRLFG